MPNGKKGDHPLSDFLHYGVSSFPPDIEQLIRDIVATDPRAFDYDDPWNERMLGWDTIDQAWFDWEKGQWLDEAREYLVKLLERSKVIRDGRDAVADYVSAELVGYFPALDAHRRVRTFVYPLDFPDPSLAGVRHSSDNFLVYTDPIHERLIIETYPAPAVLWNGNVIRRFAPGDAKELIRFLWGLHRGTLSIIEATDGPFSYGATVIQRILAPGNIDIVRHEVGFLNDSESQ